MFSRFYFSPFKTKWTIVNIIGVHIIVDANAKAHLVNHVNLLNMRKQNVIMSIRKNPIKIIAILNVVLSDVVSVERL